MDSNFCSNIIIAVASLAICYGAFHYTSDMFKEKLQNGVKEIEASGKIVPHQDALRKLAGMEAKPPRRISPVPNFPTTPNTIKFKSEAERRQEIERMLRGGYHH